MGGLVARRDKRAPSVVVRPHGASETDPTRPCRLQDRTGRTGAGPHLGEVGTQQADQARPGAADVLFTQIS